MPIITPRIRFIEKFLSRFSRLWRDPAVAGKSHFSRIQMEAFSAFIYAMFAACKRMSLASIAYNTTINYQKLQYFFSESNWRIKEPNDIRIKILHAEKTEGAQVQYCGPLGREENCNVAVASSFVSNAKHFPVDFKSYLPITTPNPENFKSKLDLCLRADQRGYC